MNKEKILEVANAIEKHSIEWLGFNMASYYSGHSEDNGSLKDNSDHECGTVVCIAGWTVILNENESCLQLIDYDFFNKAQEILEIDYIQASYLFLPPRICKYDEISSEKSVRVLRNFAETGEIDW